MSLTGAMGVGVTPGGVGASPDLLAPLSHHQRRPSRQALAEAPCAGGQLVDFRAEPAQYHTWNEAVAGLPYALTIAATRLPDTTA